MCALYGRKVCYIKQQSMRNKMRQKLVAKEARGEKFSGFYALSAAKRTRLHSIGRLH